MLKPSDFFDLSAFTHRAVFAGAEHVWDPLKTLESYLENWFSENPPCIDEEVVVAETARIYGNVSIGKGTVIEDGVCIMGPTVIGENCEVRQGAYIRGSGLMGDHSILGHASEMKNSILLNAAKAPHFAYVGDSILGNDVNLGAGTKLSNLTVSSEKDLTTGKRPTIRLRVDGAEIDTGLAKMGAIIGDNAQTGCNAVTNPGTIIGKNTLVYANTSVAKGLVPENSIVKLRQVTEIADRS
jgi:UDP-N-acetylglucosamine diphosphorylase / glucose-1-phosphate thymidylyltransferase / UDP-N-acetylgalactosamine diphosphorylase / glucosamine-1-phosphate N-acetyltransferase / galactosamine-1-phosphate N-acetyltransferase